MSNGQKNNKSAKTGKADILHDMDASSAQSDEFAELSDDGFEEILNKTIDKKESQANAKPLYIRFFGVFDIVYDGKSIFNEYVRQQRAFEILRYLVAQQGKEILPEAMAESIWPGNEYSNLRNVVRTYVFRLKRFLSVDNALGVDLSDYIDLVGTKGHYKVTMNNIVSDVQLFDDCIKNADREDNTAAKIEQIHKMIDICSDEFLQDCNSDDWIIPYRNYFYQKYCEKVIYLVNNYWMSGKNHEIITVCQKVFRLYDLNDKINVFYLRALHAEKKNELAINHYNMIANKMYTNLGVNPSDEMKRMYVLLRAEGNNVSEQASGGGLSEMDQRNIWQTMLEIINNYMDNSGKSVSMGHISIENGSKGNLSQTDYAKAMEALRQSLDIILRKDDSFAMIGYNEAIVLFKFTREEFYSYIVDRIKNTFTEKCNLPVELKIRISPIIVRRSFF